MKFTKNDIYTAMQVIKAMENAGVTLTDWDKRENYEITLRDFSKQWHTADEAALVISKAIN